MQMAVYGAYPCFFAFLGLYHGLGIWCLCVVARAVRLYQIFLFHRAASKRYRDFSLVTSLMVDTESSVWARPQHHPVADLLNAEHNTRPTLRQPIQAPQSIERRANRSAWIIVGTGFVLITSYVIAIVVGTDHVVVADDLFTPQDPSTVIGIVGKTSRGLSCTKNDPVWWPAFALIAAYNVIFTPGALFALRHMNDTYGIRQDLYFTSVFCIPAFIMYFVIATFIWHYKDFGPNDVIYFIFGVSHFMSVVVPLCRMWMEDRSRRNIRMNYQSFERVVKDPALFKELQDFAIRDFCSEQTIFMEEVMKIRSAAKTALTGRNSVPIEPPSIADPILRKSASKSGISSNGFEMFPTPTRSQTDSFEVRTLPPHIIWQCAAVLDVFIRPGSQMELNLSASIRKACIAAVESGNVTINVFDAAYVEVANSLFLNTYPKLVRSLGNNPDDRGYVDSYAR
ncbi:hypothetical protein BJ742DRAFT_17585 [Cladochytrium replicatum]|nr:hypothetical protein BJ742DRAFT_17585 [Cladochytrium replicatum]